MSHSVRHLKTSERVCETRIDTHHQRLRLELHADVHALWYHWRRASFGFIAQASHDVPGCHQQCNDPLGITEVHRSNEQAVVLGIISVLEAA